jgi:aminopeptidase N
MRCILTVSYFLLLSLAGFTQRNIDVLHYKFQVELFDSTNEITGITEITFRFLKPDSVFKIDLRVAGSHGKGMRPQIVKNEKLAGAGNHEDGIVFRLKKPADPDSIYSVTIVYSGEPKDGLIISKNKFGDRSFFADNWPDRAQNWLPCVDDPADKASFEFIVTAPRQYQVVSNGIFIEERYLPGNKKLTHWKEDVPLSTKIMVIGAAKFAVRQYEDSPPNIPVTAWTFPQDSAAGFRNYSQAPEILKFFSNYIGPYPYKKLANVQSKTIFGGMENAGAIFYSEGSASSKTSIESLLAHEIAHQWFGDMLSEKNYSHVWLSEGFATYMTDIYFESKYGKDSAAARLRKERKDVIGFDNGRPVVDTVSKGMELLNANSYQKGAWVLHMLRNEAGDSAFHLVIQKFYNRYKGKNADTEDLLKLVEEVTKKDYKQFFKQWLYTPGIPELKLKWESNKKNNAVSITVEQKQNHGVFQFPLQIAIEDGSGKQKTVTLNITKETETFTIQSATPVSSLVFDPFTRLLFDGK